jgi:hypothetical protein
LPVIGDLETEILEVLVPRICNIARIYGFI